MLIPVNHATLMGDLAADFGREFEDESEVEQNYCARMADLTSEEGSGEGSPVSSRASVGCILDRPPVKVIPCPRCQSMNTKFCYYNNYSVNQPRHFCRNCQRYWTVGGTLRNVPVGGGSRKKTRTRSRNDPYLVRSGTPLDTQPSSGDGLLSANSCMQQLSALSASLNGFAPFPTSASQLPFLQFALEQGQNPSLFPQMPPKTSTHLSGLQEVPDVQSFYDVPQISPVNPTINNGFFLPDLHFGSHTDALAPVMAKAGLWSTPAQQLQALTGGHTPAWDEPQRPLKAKSLPSQQLGHLSGCNPPRMNATVLPPTLKHADFWETALMHDRLVPHVSNSWDEPSSGILSPNSSTTEEERSPPSNCFGYHEDVVSQPWVRLQASDILF